MSVHQARIAHAKHLPALPSRPIIVTHSALLKFLSLFNASGISHRLPFCTSQLFCPAFAMWFNPGLPLSFPVHCLVLMLSRPFIVTPACWLLLKLSFNAMCGDQFAKPYPLQHGICASYPSSSSSWKPIRDQ